MRNLPLKKSKHFFKSTTNKERTMKAATTLVLHLSCSSHQIWSFFTQKTSNYNTPTMSISYQPPKTTTLNLVFLYVATFFGFYFKKWHKKWDLQKGVEVGTKESTKRTRNNSNKREKWILLLCFFFPPEKREMKKKRVNGVIWVSRSG